jgi:NAD(P)-dependent dehydrogenase (short-subunit alcohol dehydrogenase family)
MRLDSRKLEGKVSIVTGGGSGIGRAIALQFARSGSKVTVVGTNLEALSQTVKMIRDSGGEGSFVQTDVTNAGQVMNMALETLKNYGRIDVLVNNAGILTSGPIEDLSERDWDKVIDVNLKGPFLCSKAVAKHFIARRSGVVLNIISISAEIPEIYCGAYTPSKAGLLGLTKLLAVEWAKNGVRVVGISPGPVRTALHKRLYDYGDPAIREARHRALPLGRPGEPEEIAALAEFLVSDDATYITGTTFVIDGGSTVSMFHTVQLLKEYATRKQAGASSIT